MGASNQSDFLPLITNDSSPTIFEIDINQQELTNHGTEEFPCTYYIDRYSNHSFPWHWHNEIELGFIQKGNLCVLINEKQYILSEGTGVFLNSGVLHAYSNNNAKECIFPNILFHPSLIYGTNNSVFLKKYLSNLLDAVNLSHIILHETIPWQKNALDLIKKSYQVLIKKEWGYEFILRNYLTDFLLLLIKHCDELITYKQSPEIMRIRQIIDYIKAHYTEPIQLKQISNAVSISERECHRCFNKIIGTSPKQYIIDLRIQKAKELLTNTSLSIAEIYGCCGFQNQSYFTKIFRERMGMSPSKYRKSQNI